jgi:hypothetical protein
MSPLILRDALGHFLGLIISSLQVGSEKLGDSVDAFTA